MKKKSEKKKDMGIASKKAPKVKKLTMKQRVEALEAAVAYLKGVAAVPGPIGMTGERGPAGAPGVQGAPGPKSGWLGG